MVEVEHRRAARAVLLTPAGQILLMCACEPASGRRVWFTPGGGLEPGEEPLAAVRREVLEETGVDIGQVGPPLWIRRHEFDWGDRRIRQVETYYHAPIEPFEPEMVDNPSTGEAEAFQEFRWLTPAAIRALPDIVAPRRLADLVDALIADGPPTTPLDAGI